MKDQRSLATIPSYDLLPDTGKPYFVKIDVAEERTFRQRAVFLSPHRKNYFLLVYVKRGTGRHWVDMVPYELKPDTFYFTTPEQVHLKEEATLTGTTIALGREFFALKDAQHLEKLSLLKNLENGHELILSPDETAELENLLNKIVIEYNKNTDFSDGLFYAYLRVLLLFTNRIYQVQYNAALPFLGRELYHRFLNCVEENYRKIHEVRQYAGLLNLSASRLNALIKKQSGNSPITHIHDRLVLEAKRILFHTEKSVKEISFELGFSDDSYFSRFFKRATGEAPLAYRNSIKELYV